MKNVDFFVFARYAIYNFPTIAVIAGKIAECLSYVDIKMEERL